MDITRAQHASLSDMFATVGADSELEVVFYGITQEAFQRVIEYFSSAYQQPWSEQSNTLDVSHMDRNNDRSRMSIVGMSDISRFCNTQTIPENAQFLKKNQLSNVHFAEYSLRVNHNRETKVVMPLDKNNMESLFLNDRIDKVYRLKKRYSMAFPHRHFRLDATVLKTSQRSRSFIDSEISKVPETYELEIEYLPGEGGGKRDTLVQQLLECICETLLVLQNSETLLSHSRLRSIKETYKSLFGLSREHMVGSKPVTLDLKHLYGENNIQKTHCVTEKADGERHLVFVDALGYVYLINNRLQFMGVDMHADDAGRERFAKQYERSVFDSEVVTTRDERAIILLFDAYVVKGASVDRLPLMADTSEPSRLGKLDAFLKTVEEEHRPTHFAWRVKKFLGGNLFRDAATLLLQQTAQNFPYHTDGLIYMPKAAPAVLQGTWDQALKWKPPNENTIDFLVRIDRDASGQYHTIRQEDGTLVHKLHLFVGKSRVDPVQLLIRMTDGTQERRGRDAYQFTPFVLDDIPSSKTSLCYVSLDAQGSLRCRNGDLVQDQSIVEMFYELESERWVPMRVRKDKTDLLHRNHMQAGGTANDFYTAENIWYNIHAPVTEAHVKGEHSIDADALKADDVYYDRRGAVSDSAMVPMKEFHNKWVKDHNLLKRFQGKASSLFDIACGRGGDLQKWLRNRFDRVVGIDLFEENIGNGVYARLSKMHWFNRNYRYAFIPFDASVVIGKESLAKIPNEDYRYLANVLWGHQKSDHPSLKRFYGLASKAFDVVSCQFAVHYFFDAHERLERFCANVAQHLRPGGFFVGTCLDGATVDAMFRDANTAVDERLMGKKDGRTIWSLWKQYDTAWDEEHPESNIGKAIDVYIESINNKIREYLVDYQLLKKKLAEVGIHELTDAEVKDLGAFGSTGSFRDLHEQLLTTEDQDILQISPDVRDRIRDMSEDEKTISFANRFFIFRKAPGPSPPASKSATRSDAKKNRVVKKKAVPVPEPPRPAPAVAEEPKKKRVVKKKAVPEPEPPQPEPAPVPPPVAPAEEPKKKRVVKKKAVPESEPEPPQPEPTPPPPPVAPAEEPKKKRVVKKKAVPESEPEPPQPEPTPPPPPVAPAEEPKKKRVAKKKAVPEPEPQPETAGAVAEEPKKKRVVKKTKST